MSSRFSELCTLLVHEFIGSLPAAVFSTLIKSDGLPLQHIVQATQLLPRFVKNALALLIERRLVNYSELLGDRCVYYQANTRNAYKLIRAGKHSQLIETYFGKHASSIVLELQEQSIICSSELKKFALDLSRIDNANARTEPDALNGVYIPAYLQPVGDLFDSKHVVAANPRDVQSLAYVIEQIETEIKPTFAPGGATVAAATRAFQGLVQKRLKRDRAGNVLSRRNLISLMAHGSTTSDSQKISDPSQTQTPLEKLNGNLIKIEVSKVNGDIEDGPKRKKRRTNLDQDPETFPELDQQTQNENLSTGTRRTRQSAKFPPEQNKNSDSISAQERNGTRPARGSKRAVLESEESEDGDDVQVAPQSSKRRKVLETSKQAKTKVRTGLKGHKLTNGHTDEDDETSQLQTERDSATDDDVTQTTTLKKHLIPPSELQHYSTTGDRSENEAYFRLDLEKLDVSLRSQLLADLSMQCLGEPTSRVYAALLQCLESNIRRCGGMSTDEELPDTETEEISAASNHYENYYNAQGVLLDEITLKYRQSGGKTNTKEKSDVRIPSEVSRDERYPPFANDESRRAEVEYHLHILAEHENGFVETTIMPGGEQRWRVNFARLSVRMVQRELENIVETKFGGSSARLVRILHNKGKMEEKYLANIALIKQKDIRSQLALMQEAGFLDVQEVPRDASRQPSRTIYLWFFDQDRCRRLVLDNMYQMMSRLLQRLHFERANVKNVLDKAARTDVAGREDQLLNEAEKAALQQLERKEDRLWIQISRLDDVVALLRDFYQKPPDDGLHNDEDRLDDDLHKHTTDKDFSDGGII